jgi:hypothetical protein
MLVIPDGIHLVFLPPYSPELQRMSSASGHSRAEAIANCRFETLDELRRGRKQSAVLPFKTMRPVSAIPHSSTGGLPRSCKRDLTVSNPMFQQSPLFVSLTHLRDISLRS